MFQITGKDIIAVLVVTICGVLMGLGIDGEVKSILALVVGYYFGTKVLKK